MRSSVVETAGCRLAYDVRGSGPPVVFIQGVGVHGAGWTPQVDDLQDRFTCLTFDNRGMSRSLPAAAPISVDRMADDVLAIMAHAGIRSAHLVGHSLGGPVAIATALRSRDSVKSLGLLCTVGRGREATRLSARMLVLGVRSRVGSRASRRRAFLEIVLSPEAIARQSADAWAAGLEPLFGHDIADQPPIALKQLGALRAFDEMERLGQLRSIPSLVISAELDPIAPPRYGRVLAERLGARFVEIKRASHGLPIEYPSDVNQLLAHHFDAAEASEQVPA